MASLAASEASSVALIANLMLAIDSASLAASIVPISILLLASQKIYKKTYHMLN